MDTQKTITLKQRPERCPICGGEVWTIVYGEPTYEAYEKRFETKTVFGGCCITGHDPAWQCIECDTLIYQEEYCWNGCPAHRFWLCKCEE